MTLPSILRRGSQPRQIMKLYNQMLIALAVGFVLGLIVSL